MNGLSNKEMKQTKPALARTTRSSLLISVLAGPRLALTRHTVGLASDPLLLSSVPRTRVY
jgi:hypothetical protein